MERHKRIFEEENEKPEWLDKGVTAYLKALRDENFGSENQRKKMIDILTSLHNSSDKRGRLLFKKIGGHLSDIGDEIIKYGQSKED